MNLIDKLDDKTLLQSLDKIAFEIGNKLDAFRPVKAPWKHYTNWASEINFPCRRMLTYARLNWKDRRPMDLKGRYRVEEGIEQEKWVKRVFSEIGYEVDLSATHWDWEKYEITGRIDGALKTEIPLQQTLVIPGGAEIGQTIFLVIPVEVKSMRETYFQSTRTIEEIKCHTKWWINKYTSQLNTYLLMMGLPGGLLVLKTFGQRPRILPMLIDYELGEKNIQTAEFVNNCVKKKFLPSRIIYTPEVCDLCGFNHLCHPVKTTDIIDGTQIPPETIAEMTRFCDLQDQLDGINPDFNRLQKKLIGDKKKPGIFRGKNALFEGFEIISKPGKRKTYNVPKNIKDPFLEEVDTMSTKIERSL